MSAGNWIYQVPKLLAAFVFLRIERFTAGKNQKISPSTKQFIKLPGGISEICWLPGCAETLGVATHYIWCLLGTPVCHQNVSIRSVQNMKRRN